MAGTTVPKPANQGGHGSAPTQGAKVQSKKTAAVPPGKPVMNFSSQPGGYGGSNKS